MEPTDTSPARSRRPGGPLHRIPIGGGQPTQWHFWTLSERIGIPADAANREKFLADAPGETILGPRSLKGDRFTALGQFGIDLEYFIASPANTPRHTVRYGLNPSAADVPRFSEYQDLLQLTLPGDGSNPYRWRSTMTSRLGFSQNWPSRSFD